MYRMVFLILYSPHHCVGFFFFAWIPPLLFPLPLPPRRSLIPQLITAPLLTPHSLQLHFSSQLITAPLLITTHHRSTPSHTSLIASQLITAPLLTPHSSQHSSQLARGCLSRGRRSTQNLLEALRGAWAPLGPRLPFVWQALYTDPPGGARAHVGAAGAAVAFHVAAAVHRASWSTSDARGRRWGRGCLSRGRRSTQSLLVELRRAWAPLGPRLPFVWQAQHTEPPGGVLGWLSHHL